MNQKLKDILSYLLVALIVFIILIYVTNREVNKCTDRMETIDQKWFKETRANELCNIDLRQCRSYEELIAESLWDCQEKLSVCWYGIVANSTDVVLRVE